MRQAYLFYEAGQAVAAAHLGLKIRHVSGNPATSATQIIIPRDSPRAQMILWLTGMAAEKKGTGRSDPLRRTRNRLRAKVLIDAALATIIGPRAKRTKEVRMFSNQAQDRANAICADLFQAIEEVVALLADHDTVPGARVVEILRKVKAQRFAAGQPTATEVPLRLEPLQKKKSDPRRPNPSM